MNLDSLFKIDWYLDEGEKLIQKVIRNGGFLIWPILYWWLFYLVIDNILRKQVLIFSVIGVILTVVSILFIFSLKRQSREYKRLVEDEFLKI
jgi:hypothetical protein